jgi:hypothetical protein
MPYRRWSAWAWIAVALAIAWHLGALSGQAARGPEQPRGDLQREVGGAQATERRVRVCDPRVLRARRRGGVGALQATSQRLEGVVAGAESQHLARALELGQRLFGAAERLQRVVLLLQRLRDLRVTLAEQAAHVALGLLGGRPRPGDVARRG